MPYHNPLFRLAVLILFMLKACQSLSNGIKPVYSMSTTTSTGTTKNVFCQWFRMMDLRLHDNPSLCRTVELSKKSGIVPIFCFDPRIFGGRSNFGANNYKCGPKRAKFVLECVQDLRKQLEAQGSGLLVAHGKPEDVIPQALKQIDESAVPQVFCQEEVCSEELAVDKALRAALTLGSQRATLHTTWGSTLYDIDDLPFNDGVNGMPDTFTPFRNKLEKSCSIGKPLHVPKKSDLALTDGAKKVQDESGNSLLSYMPTLSDLGYTTEDIDFANAVDSRGVLDFKGGESVALARVKDYIWTKDLLKVYFDTRNGMIGPDYSTKFAPWLAHGCLSPRFVAKECKKYEEERVANKSTYWVVFELIWRDFFKYFALKHGNNIFFPGGTIGSDKRWGYDPRHVKLWTEGSTGYPLVDANMRELAATGFMSNRGRQNVCSFLALEMNQDWRHGAEYFECVLLDYDVHSNWGNWASGAGMTGGRINRFNIVKQSKDYDQHGDYVRHWLPELAKVPKEFVHEPWKMTQFQQMEYDCRLGVDYPNPLVPPYNPKQDGHNRGGRGGGRGGRGGGGRSNSRRGGQNKNRGRGQREDMKSLPTGEIRMK